jgi:hypothetical protein
MLDYGCGYGTDADIIKMDKYDPNFYPGYPTGLYDTITCFYVLNILKRHQAQTVLEKIKALLLDEGKAYITVSNLKKSEDTSYGVTYRPIILKSPVFVYQPGYFTMYQFGKFDIVKVSMKN